MSFSFSRMKRYCLLKVRLALSGGLLSIHGVKVGMPMRHAVHFYRLLLSGAYEKREAAMVNLYVPRDRGVVELGSSLGVIATVLRAKLNPDQKMISVEAIEELSAVAAENIARYDRQGNSEVLNAAVSYSGGEVLFSTDENAHANTLATGADRSNVIRVPAITLGDIVQKMVGSTGLTLVCDIEGAEWDVFAHDRAALSNFDLAIIETHPDVFRKNGNSLEVFHQLVNEAGLKIIDQDGDVFVYRR